MKRIKRLLSPKKKYTKLDLVSFGNYLLSKERNERIKYEPVDEVCNGDLDNWINR